MKAKVNRKRQVSFFLAGTAETSTTIKVIFILYLESDSESGLESESSRSPESESESEQTHHDSAPLVYGHAFKNQNSELCSQNNESRIRYSRFVELSILHLL